MRRFTRYAMGGILGLALSSAAWAQQRDLEVTMDVVPANASAGKAGEIKLPITLPETASPKGREASASGLETANRARELGSEFGKERSETARKKGKGPKGP